MEQLDGRVTRGFKNRELIVNALIDLIQDGHLNPSADLVSERAGVGLRTVFRHFQDMPTLYSEVAKIAWQSIEPTLSEPAQGKGLKDRLMHEIDRRIAVYEKIRPFFGAYESIKMLEPSQKQHREIVKALRQSLKAWLPQPICKDKTRFEALDLSLSVDSWMRLRTEQGLSKPVARSVFEHCALAVVGA